MLKFGLVVKLLFKDRKKEGDDIWSFFFEAQEPATWLAGQSIRLELPRPTYGVDERRFTISAAPFEKLIRITTRLSNSTFKQGLAALESGELIDAFSIEGTFLWQDRPKLFIAGGIGITPFRSLLTQAAHEDKKLDAVLIRSSRQPQPIFKQEFDELAKRFKDFKVVYLNRRAGREDIENIDGWKNKLVYLSGPEKMVAELAKELQAAGLPANRLKLDLFTGNLSI